MRCPICRADNNHTEQCRRCKGDLTLLVQLHRDRTAHLAAAECHAGKANGDSCLTAARHAQAIRCDADSLRLLAIGYLLQNDFENAWSAYQQCQFARSENQ